MQEQKLSKAPSFRSVWLSAAMLLLSGQIALYVWLQLRPGRIAFIPYFVGPKLFIFAAACCLVIMLLDLARKRRFLLLRDWRVWSSIAALVVVIFISVSAYRVYPSSYDGKPSNTCFRLPLDGEVAVVQGGATLDVNYHAAFPAQRYAYDLGTAREGKTHRGEGYVVWDYYIYGQPVPAPAEGLVIHASDGDPDQSPSEEGWLRYKTLNRSTPLIL